MTGGVVAGAAVTIFLLTISFGMLTFPFAPTVNVYLVLFSS